MSFKLSFSEKLLEKQRHYFGNNKTGNHLAEQSI